MPELSTAGRRRRSVYVKSFDLVVLDPFTPAAVQRRRGCSVVRRFDIVGVNDVRTNIRVWFSRVSGATF